MPKLVLLSPGMTGRTHELKADKTTIGRLEDNAFQIAEASVSSHHCEILLKGGDVIVRDLNSTNGSFINGQPITEATLKPSQILRLGQVEVRLESDTPAASQKKVLDHTQVVPQGIKMDELGQSPRAGNPGFEKKSNTATKWFIVGLTVVGLAILVWLIMTLMSV